MPSELMIGMKRADILPRVGIDLSIMYGVGVQPLRCCESLI